MKYELITLPYEANALEPVISKETLGFHHGKHLNAYVNNLNGLIEGTKYEDMPLEDIVKTADGGVFNNAGQILNHNLYFTQFRAPKVDNKPIRFVRCLQGRVYEERRYAVWLWLGVALRRQGRQTTNHAGDQCRQPRPARIQAFTDL